MRAMSQDLLGRLQQSQQTVYNNANPSLKVLISRGLSKELFKVYTIENLESLGAIDASARRTVVENDPDLVYVVRIVGGVADILSHALPYDPTIVWETEFTLGAATDVAIEFDGAWERDYITKKHNFVTEEFPWIFHVASGSLKAQLWQEASIELDTGVSKIRAIRGWVPANGEITNDQGLIILYLKLDGTLWYRNYCNQVGGTKSWETPRQITAFTGTIDDIALFRTNDFRVGIVADIDGNVEWIVSTRNWAGMSVWPEIFTTSIEIAEVNLVVSEIVTVQLAPQTETFTDPPVDIALMPLNVGSEELLDSVPSMVSGVVVDDHTFSIEYSGVPVIWSNAVFKAYGFSGHTLASYTIDGNWLTAVTVDAIEELGFAITLNSFRVQVRYTDHCIIFVPSASIYLQGTLDTQYETFSNTISISDVSLSNEVVVRSAEDTQYETFETSIQIDTVELTNVRVASIPV